MRVEKYYALNENYRWFIIYQDYTMEVYLEKYHKHWFFGGFRDTGYCFLFKTNESGESEFGGDLTGNFNNRCRTMHYTWFKVSDFNLKQELDSRYKSYITYKEKLAEEQNKYLKTLDTI